MKDLGSGEEGVGWTRRLNIRQTRRNIIRGENKRAINWLNLNLPLAGFSWPLYIGGQVSRIRSGSTQIIMYAYDIILYFDYIYAWAYPSGPGGTKIMGFNSYTLVSSPRDSTKFVDSGWISNLQIFDLQSLTWSTFVFFSSFDFIEYFIFLFFSWGFWLASLVLLTDQRTRAKNLLPTSNSSPWTRIRYLA
jgi:hypothetical protein